MLVIHSAERLGIMLPRITNALAKFLKPIAGTVVGMSKADSATKQELPNHSLSHQNKKKDEEKKDHSPKQEQNESIEAQGTDLPHSQPNSPALTLISSKDSELENSPSVSASASQSQSVASSHPLTELMQFFQTQKDKYLQRSGPSTYRFNLKNRKKNSKFRKGTILDHKVD